MGRCVLHFFFFIKTKGIIDFFPGGNFKSFTLFNSSSFFILVRENSEYGPLHESYKTSTSLRGTFFIQSFFFFNGIKADSVPKKLIVSKEILTLYLMEMPKSRLLPIDPE